MWSCLRFLLLAVIGGCAAVGPDYQTPATSVPATFTNAAQPGFSSGPVETTWWRGFREPELTRLIEAAIRSNYDLRIATANLREARALRAETSFELYPIVTTHASYTRLRRSTAIFPNIGASRRDIKLYNIGFDATWEVDFFGRVRRAIEARQAEVEAAQADLRDVMVSVSAEIARNYFDLRGLQNQLAVARKNADNQRTSLALTQVRLEGGRGTELDTSRAQAQLNSTLATIPPLEADIKRAIYRLSVLTGRLPEALTQALERPAALPAAPSIVSLGRPEALLRRRPDIRSAESSLAAATASIGIATADLFPRVTFVGNVALEAGSIGDLGGRGSDTFSFGPSIRWAAFDSWRVQARIEAAEAGAEAELAAYEQTVLNALEETENALVNYGRQQARRDFLRAAAQASEKAAELARLRFEEGVADFLTVLDAERRMLEDESQLAQSEAATATALVAIYKALGGGWER